MRSNYEISYHGKRYDSHSFLFFCKGTNFLSLLMNLSPPFFISSFWSLSFVVLSGSGGSDSGRSSYSDTYVISVHEE